MIELRRESKARGIGRGLAKVGVVALAAATMGSVGIVGALAQENEGIYGGGMAVGDDVSGDSVPMAEDTSSAPSPEIPAVEVPVPGAVTSVMGAEELPAPVDLDVPGVEMPAPVDLSALGEGSPSPVDIDAIFASLNLPAPAADAAEAATGPDISLGGTVGGDAAGTISMGGDQSGDISLGGGTGGGGVSGG